MLEITSKENSRLKHARAVRDGRERGEIFIEGLRLAEEAVNTNLEITDCFFTAEFAATTRGASLLEKVEKFNPALVSAKLLENIAETKTPQGIVVLARKPETGKAQLEKAVNSRNENVSERVKEINALTDVQVSAAPLLVILHKLNNPANVGAILRTAEAASCTGVILTINSADPFSPKSLRGAMGSAFRLPLWTNASFNEAITFCRAYEIKTICAELNAQKSHTQIDWTEPKALIIGSEAHGLAPEEIAQTDESLKIPMQTPVESLNAAVACSVVLYEAARQKVFRKL